MSPNVPFPALAVVLVVGSSLASCTPGGVASQLLQTPELPANGQTKCKVASSHAKPLVVEWPSADRAELEAKAQSGIVVVRYDGCEMRLLSQCEAQGAYSYTPVTPKTDTVVIDNEDDLWASLPLGAAALEGKLANAGRLNVVSTTVGRFAASRNELTLDDLSGRCEGATHVVTGLVVGAFEFFSGAEAEVGGGAQVLGVGAGARSRAKKEILSKDGDIQACEKTGEQNDGLPPRSCSALLRIEVASIIADSGEIARVRNGNACETGDAKACDALGLQLLYGRGGSKDEARAVALFQRACDAEVGVACGNLGDAYREGKGVLKDLAKTNEAWSRGCELGWLNACNALGNHYRDGVAVPPDPVRAGELFRKACDGGVGTGCGNLGDMYDKGIGVAQDPVETATQWERGCRAGWAQACNAVGFRYRDGKGVGQDASRAAEVFSRGCDLGSGQACGAFGDMLKAGQGRTMNLPAAVEAYVRGCEHDWPQACNAAGWHLWKGVGVAADGERATAMLRKACDAGQGIACANLGDMALPRDPAQAHELYRRGCDLGWENACKVMGK